MDPWHPSPAAGIIKLRRRGGGALDLPLPLAISMEKRKSRFSSIVIESIERERGKEWNDLKNFELVQALLSCVGLSYLLKFLGFFLNVW